MKAKKVTKVEQIDDLAQSQVQESETPHEPDIIIGSREQIFHLLAEAAEIEHTLMCSYLYAAFSLKIDDRDLSSEERKAVKRWNKAILAVAIEEMSHLLSANNLIVALGGCPHFSRPNFPVSSGYFPADLVLRLTPFSEETLEHFIFIERPIGVEETDGEGFESEDLSREPVYQGLMPSSQDYTTVSHLYEAIRSNLTAFVDRTGAETLFIGSAARQIGPETIEMDGVDYIVGLESALRAIDSIVEQGEGSPSDREDSHYRKFQTIAREYAELLKANPQFVPAHPVAENPVMRRPPEPEGKVFIEAKSAARLLDFANAVYGLLLQLLVQSYSESAAATGDRQRFMDAAIEVMHILDKVARWLAQLPASEEHPGVNAGITFTLLHGVEPASGSEIERTLILERLLQLTAGAKKIARSIPEISAIATQLEKLAQKFLNASKK